MSLPSKGIRLEEAQLYDKVTKIQTLIIDKLADLRKKKLTYFCQHFYNLSENCDDYSPVQNYYNMFWKLFLTIELCKQKTEIFGAELKETEQQLKKIQILFNKREELRNYNIRFKSKSRRKADEIIRPHKCPEQECDKAYGSELALNLHIKMKHRKNKKYILAPKQQQS